MRGGEGKGKGGKYLLCGGDAEEKKNGEGWGGNVWRRKMFGLRRSKRTEKEKEVKWEKWLQSRRLEIEGSRRGPCGPKNLTFTYQGIQFETVTKRRKK